MSAQTLFFYDLETSGLDPKKQRIMQFAGQRTDLNLKPIGEPFNIKIALSDEVLPEPGAVMVTGITPQSTQEEGYSEADFCKMFCDEVCIDSTIMVGFNNIRFDDEFIRYTLYRNLYDAYEWSWANSCSRWDMLDVSRMVRALRPEGIEWPNDTNGKPTNRLELLASANNLTHDNAHDALSDVLATIEVARLIKTKQPKMFEYLLQTRGKKEVEQLVNLNHPQPFVYTSGRYESDFLKTTVAYPIGEGKTPGSLVVYDLRYDPDDFADLSLEDMKKRLWARFNDESLKDLPRIPAKQMMLNRCPAVAPMGVIDKATQKRLNISLETVQKNLQTLIKSPDLVKNITKAFTSREPFAKYPDVDGQLYDGFIGDTDKKYMATARAATRQELMGLELPFKDPRLKELFLRYKARNYTGALTGEEQTEWEAYRYSRITNDMPAYQKSLAELAALHSSNEEKQFLLEELRLWAESIVPIVD